MKTGEYLTKRKKAFWLDTEVKTFRFRKLIASYNDVRIRRNTNKLNDKDYEVIAAQYRPDLLEKHPIMAIMKTKALLKNEQVRQIADSELSEALVNAGVSKKWLVGQRKEVINKALKSDDVEGLRIANETLDVLEGYAGMKNTDTTTATVIDYGAIDKSISQPVQIETTEAKQLEQPLNEIPQHTEKIADKVSADTKDN